MSRIEEIGRMWEDLEVTLEKVHADKLKEKPSADNLGFGVHFTDHMFLMKWDRERGWHDSKICPYHDFTLNPAAMVFHYGQAIFEGLKAYRGKDDQLLLFRPKDNFERMNNSALRMCMPRISAEKMVKILKALIYLEKDWVPKAEGAIALYSTDDDCDRTYSWSETIRCLLFLYYFVSCRRLLCRRLQSDQNLCQ